MNIYSDLLLTTSTGLFHSFCAINSRHGLVNLQAKNCVSEVDKLYMSCFSKTPMVRFIPHPHLALIYFMLKNKPTAHAKITGFFGLRELREKANSLLILQDESAFDAYKKFADVNYLLSNSENELFFDFNATLSFLRDKDNVDHLFNNIFADDFGGIQRKHDNLGDYLINLYECVYRPVLNQIFFNSGALFEILVKTAPLDLLEGSSRAQDLRSIPKRR